MGVTSLPRFGLVVSRWLHESPILGSVPQADLPRVALEAAQTAPPRENGGNQDIKDLARGSRVFCPVFVDGANLSVGDLHFCQGDGTITFCGAIEMGGCLELPLDRIPPLRGSDLLLRHLGHRRRSPDTPGPLPGLPAGVPARHRLPQRLRPLPRTGLPAAGGRTRRGTSLQRRRHPHRERDHKLPRRTIRRSRRNRSSAARQGSPPRAAREPQSSPRRNDQAHRRELGSPLPRRFGGLVPRPRVDGKSVAV